MSELGRTIRTLAVAKALVQRLDDRADLFALTECHQTESRPEFLDHKIELLIGDLQKEWEQL